MTTPSYGPAEGRGSGTKRGRGREDGGGPCMMYGRVPGRQTGMSLYQGAGVPLLLTAWVPKLAWMRCGWARVGKRQRG